MHVFIWVNKDSALVWGGHPPVPGFISRDVQSIVYKKVEWGFSELPHKYCKKKRSVFLSVKVFKNSRWTQLWINDLGKFQNHTFQPLIWEGTRPRGHLGPNISSCVKVDWYWPRFQTRVRRIPETSFTEHNTSACWPIKHKLMTFLTASWLLFSFG